jgi:hypothetical protein
MAQKAEAVCEFQGREAPPLPLSLCWSLWIAISAGLWVAIARLISVFAF